MPTFDEMFGGFRDALFGSSDPTSGTSFDDSVLGRISNAVDGIKTTLTTLPDSIATKITDALGAAITKKADDMASKFIEALTDFLKTFVKAPDPLPLQPVQASAVVSQLATAIHDAEKTLNGQSLVISSGTVELDVYLADPSSPGQAGAHAKITFNIQPRP